MPRPGFVLEVDRSTPPIMFWRGENISLERLPAESVLDSCVYHSATGCSLPRELRSETCNRHLCGKLKNLQATRPGGPVLGVFFDNGVWIRSVLLDKTGGRVVAESGQE
jgi:hypothetical protein